MGPGWHEGCSTATAGPFMAEPRPGSLRCGPWGTGWSPHESHWVSGTLHTFPLSVIHFAQGSITVSLLGRSGGPRALWRAGGQGTAHHGCAVAAQSLTEQGDPGSGPLPGPCCWPPCVHVSGHLCLPCQHFPSILPCPQARDVYEEAIRTVMTVRDFTQVFDSYAQFEESMIAAKMETASELGREEDGELLGSHPGQARREGPGWLAQGPRGS